MFGGIRRHRLGRKRRGKPCPRTRNRGVHALSHRGLLPAGTAFVAGHCCLQTLPDMTISWGSPRFFYNFWCLVWRLRHAHGHCSKNRLPPPDGLVICRRWPNCASKAARGYGRLQKRSNNDRSPRQDNGAKTVEWSGVKGLTKVWQRGVTGWKGRQRTEWVKPNDGSILTA